MAKHAGFDRATLEEAFQALGQLAVKSGRLVEIAVYGGSALVLTLADRVATRDVDAVIQNDAKWLRGAVAIVAEEREWPPDWLDDGVKGFLSDRDREPEARKLFRRYPEEHAGLRVFVSSPRYFFAMKCLAMRTGGVDQTRDRADIEALAREIGVTTSEQAIDIVSRFYPASRVSPKTQLAIEEIFSPAKDSTMSADETNGRA